jgi:hypothetical protein
MSKESNSPDAIRAIAEENQRAIDRMREEMSQLQERLQALERDRQQELDAMVNVGHGCRF